MNPKDLHPLEGCSDFPPSPRLLLLPERELWRVSYVSRVCATGEQGPHTPTLRPWLKAVSGYELASTSCGQSSPSSPRVGLDKSLGPDNQQKRGMEAGRLPEAVTQGQRGR